MLPNKLLVGAVWDWADVAGLKLSKRLDVGFGCPNNEDMVRMRLDPVCANVFTIVCAVNRGLLGDVKFTFRVRAAGTSITASR